MCSSVVCSPGPLCFSLFGTGPGESVAHSAQVHRMFSVKKKKKTGLKV